MFMMILFDICTNSGILTVFLIIKILFNIICILIPIIIVVKSIMLLSKTVISGDKITDHVLIIGKSILSGLIVFLLPSIFNFIFTDFVSVDSSLNQCFTNATLEGVKKAKDNEIILMEEESKANKDKLNEAIKDREEAEKEKNEEIRENIEQNNQNSNNNGASNGSNGGNSSNGSTSPGSSSGSLKTAAKNIIIGDSRTVGMCAHMGGNYNSCPFSNSGGLTVGNDYYIAQGSMSYSWFANTAVPAVNKIISANPGTTFNIYSLMGVNFLLSDIDKYIPKYKELANGVWKNHNVILVSVNPVDEAKEKQHGYSTKQANIITFNNKLKNGTSGVSNIKYCDTFNSALSSLSTSDGLHYSASTSQVIYNTMKSCGG